LRLAGEVANHPSRHSASRQLRRSTTMADLVALALKFPCFLYFSCFGHIYIFYMVTLFKDDEESDALQLGGLSGAKLEPILQNRQKYMLHLFLNPLD
jgi:hypothetical protein